MIDSKFVKFEKSIKSLLINLSIIIFYRYWYILCIALLFNGKPLRDNWEIFNSYFNILILFYAIIYDNHLYIVYTEKIKGRYLFERSIYLKFINI